MPIYAVGLTEHETPFTFGSAMPPLVFTWSINNKDIIQLQNVFHEVCICIMLSYIHVHVSLSVKHCFFQSFRTDQFMKNFWSHHTDQDFISLFSGGIGKIIHHFEEIGINQKCLIQPVFRNNPFDTSTGSLILNMIQLYHTRLNMNNTPVIEK